MSANNPSALAELEELLVKSGRFTSAELNKIHSVFWKLFWWMVILDVGAYVLNVGFGWEVPSNLLAIIVPAVLVVFATKPLLLLSVAGAGLATKVITHEPAKKAVTTFFEEGLKSAVLFVLGHEVFVLFTGNYSFQGHPKAILKIVAGLIVYGLMVHVFSRKFPGDAGKKTVYWVAVCSIVCALLGITYIGVGTFVEKYTGFDIFTVLPSKTEEALYENKKAERDRADEARAEEIRRITKETAKRPATQAENQFLASAKQATTVKASPTTATPAAADDSLLHVPANGRSVGMVPLAGHITAFDGPGLIRHCAYKGGGDEIYQENGQCPRPDSQYQWVQDTTGKDRKVAWRDVPIR